MCVVVQCYVHVDASKVGLVSAQILGKALDLIIFVTCILHVHVHACHCVHVCNLVSSCHSRWPFLLDTAMKPSSHDRDLQQRYIQYVWEKTVLWTSAKAAVRLRMACMHESTTSLKFNVSWKYNAHTCTCTLPKCTCIVLLPLQLCIQIIFCCCCSFWILILHVTKENK